ncbi:MAG: hypothetical protein AAF711_00225 [Planctomycetota bacterium]
MSELTEIFSSRRCVMSPLPQCPWANEMVLNPGVIRAPDTGRLHMLFRATGSGRESGEPPTSDWGYPIFLGYAFSDDDGETWQVDAERPAMCPALATEPKQLMTTDAWGRRTPNFANGCIEDPRLFWFEGECHLIVACRVFAPGAYWMRDDPMQCAPAWASDPGHGLGRGLTENVTVNLIYRVDLGELEARKYDRAFAYVTHLTDPAYGENRDVLLFPRRLEIDRRPRVVCLHRPWEASHYVGGASVTKPSIWYSVADSIGELATDAASHYLLAKPTFDWESNRIGGSAPPIEIEPGRWLISYHGKQDARVGYTQSVMVVEEGGREPLTLRHRCPERLLTPTEDWEQPGKFTTPCLFVTALLAEATGPWRVFYGASDERIGIAECAPGRLLDKVRRYDATGRRLSAADGVSSGMQKRRMSAATPVI